MQSSSPSAQQPHHEIPPSERLRQLFYGAHLIRDSAIALRLAHRTCANAQMLFHRFYVQVSLRDHNLVWAAGASLLLSCKHCHDEQPLRKIASVLYDRIVYREASSRFVEIRGRNVRRVLDYFGAQGFHWVGGIRETERHLLCAIGFRLTVDLPHKFVLVFLNELRQQAHAPSWSRNTNGSNPFQVLLQRAWNFANDSLLLPVSVIERAEDLACACITLALRQLSFELVQGWQVVFGSCTSECDRIASLIELVYSFSGVHGSFVDFSLTDTFVAFHPSRTTVVNEPVSSVARTGDGTNTPTSSERNRKEADGHLARTEGKCNNETKNDVERSGRKRKRKRFTDAGDLR